MPAEIVFYWPNLHLLPGTDSFWSSQLKNAGNVLVFADFSGGLFVEIMNYENRTEMRFNTTSETVRKAFAVGVTQ